MYREDQEELYELQDELEEETLRKGIEALGYDFDKLVELIVETETGGEGVYDVVESCNPEEDGEVETLEQATRRMQAWEACYIMDKAIDVVQSHEKLGEHSKEEIVKLGEEA